MAIMEISVLPVGTKSASLSEHVAKAVKVAKASGLEVTVTAMGTEVSGGVDALLALAAKMHKSVLGDGVHRVLTSIRIDERDDKETSAAGRVRSVLEKADRL
jgi:uncharacterized protein (TIGR00106 family)